MIQRAVCLITAMMLAGCAAAAAQETEMPAPAPGITQRAAATSTTTAAADPASPSTATGSATATTGTAAFTATRGATSTATPVPRPTRTAQPTLAAGWARVPAGPVQVPILLYHHVSDKINTRYALPVSTFQAQMKTLHEQGFQTVSVSQLAEVIRAGGSLPEKAVVITFDDGYLDTYANAFPIMEEYGFTGVVYIITSTLEEGKTYGYMQEAELKKLARAGWEIGSHSVTHTSLKETKIGIGNEMKQSKATLETLLGVPVRSFSYPYAISNAWIRERAAEYGYESAVSVDILVTNTPKRLYSLSRREVTRSTRLVDFQQMLKPNADEIAWLENSETQEAEGTKSPLQ